MRIDIGHFHNGKSQKYYSIDASPTRGYSFGTLTWNETSQKNQYSFLEGRANLKETAIALKQHLMSDLKIYLDVEDKKYFENLGLLVEILEAQNTTLNASLDPLGINFTFDAEKYNQKIAEMQKKMEEE